MVRSHSPLSGPGLQQRIPVDELHRSPSMSLIPASLPPLSAIGVVETDVADDDIPRRRRDIVSDIVLRPELVEGLRGLDSYSHLIVIFLMHRSPSPATLLVHPGHNPDNPPVGTFAMRTRNRPNPIGLAVVDLLRIEGNRLTVRRLDAYSGTPVLDLKPYDHYDVFTGIEVPSWSNSARGREAS